MTKPTSVAPKKRAVWPTKKSVASKRLHVAKSPRRLKKKIVARAVVATAAPNVTRASAVVRAELRRAQALALLRVVRAALFAFAPMRARVVLALRVRVVRVAIARAPALRVAIVELRARVVLRAVPAVRVRLRRWIPMN